MIQMRWSLPDAAARGLKQLQDLFDTPEEQAGIPYSFSYLIPCLVNAQLSSYPNGERYA